MTELVLYSGVGCHLCIEAEALLRPLLDARQWTLRTIDINSNPTLQTLYGVKIPVVVLPNGVEKAWPFTRAQIDRLLPRSATL